MKSYCRDDALGRCVVGVEDDIQFPRTRTMYTGRMGPSRLGPTIENAQFRLSSLGAVDMEADSTIARAGYRPTEPTGISGMRWAEFTDEAPEDLRGDRSRLNKGRDQFAPVARFLGIAYDIEMRRVPASSRWADGE